MAEQEELVTITMKTGELIGTTWREAGDVVEVEKSTAARWVKHGSAEYGGDAGKRASAPDHELGDFPAAGLFAAAGYTTLDEVKGLIADKGDAWPKSVKGITKAFAAKVSEALETQE